MKIKIHLLLYIFIFSFLPKIGYPQKQLEYNHLEKDNLRQIETYTVNLEKRETGTNIVRAKYNENFVDKKHSAPDSIALAYLKEKHLEFGISENLNNINIKKTRYTPKAKYVYFEQYIDDVPVYLSGSLVLLDSANRVTYMYNNFRDISGIGKKTTLPEITNEEAIQLAKEYLGITGKIIGNPKSVLIYFDSQDYGMILVWKVNIVATNPRGDWQVMVKAIDGQIIQVEDISSYYDGKGMIYNPDPLKTAQTTYGGDYVDNNDNINAALNAQRVEVTLRNITLRVGFYYLEGPYCVLYDAEDPVDIFPQTQSPLTGFNNFTRDNQFFEDVMVYYHVDLANRRVQDLLGLSYEDYCLYYDLDNFKADPHGMNGEDNSWYSSTGNFVEFGEGGVDDAEDAGIIWHEFGHAMQYNLSETGTMSTNPLTQAVKEGSSDYWALSYSRSITSYNWSIFAPWESSSWPESDKRSADLDLLYPGNSMITRENYYYYSQVWSSALMDIWGELGKDITDRLFIFANTIWPSTVDIPGAAEAFIEADELLYNGSHLCPIITHFAEHGLTNREPDISLINETINTNTTINGCNATLSNVVIDNNTKLTIDVGNNVTINGSFEMAPGSELEVK